VIEVELLLYWLGAFATRQGRTDQAAGAYREAVELFAAVDGDDTTRVAKTLNALGDVAVSQGDTAEARRRWNEPWRSPGRARGPTPATPRRSSPPTWATWPSLGRDVLGVAADDVAEGRAMTFDQALDSAAAWADQRRTHAT
jgi:hypothetical protein